MPATMLRAKVSPPLAELPPHLARQVWRGGQLGRSANRVVPTGHAALDAELPGGGWPVGGLTELLLAQPGIGELRLLRPALQALTADGPQARYVALIAPPYLPYAPALAAWGIALERVIWIKADARQALWAAEQTLKHEGLGAVLLWLPTVRADALRRLQVMAQDGQALAFLLRPAGAAAQSSAAPLRILCRAVGAAEGRAGMASAAGRDKVKATAQGARAAVAVAAAEDVDHADHADDQYASYLQLDIFKRRGPALAAPLHVRLALEQPAGWPRAAPSVTPPLAPSVAPLPYWFNEVPALELAAPAVIPLQESHHVVDRRDAARSAARSAQAAVIADA
jgi:hypothetical protein